MKKAEVKRGAIPAAHGGARGRRLSHVAQVRGLWQDWESAREWYAYVSANQISEEGWNAPHNRTCLGAAWGLSARSSICFGTGASLVVRYCEWRRPHEVARELRWRHRRLGGVIVSGEKGQGNQVRA